MNQLTLTGNLTRDPESSTAASGTEVTRFSLAWNDPYKKDAPPVYFKCVAFNKTADVVSRYCRKGDKVLVQGPVGLDKWTTKDNESRADLSVVVNMVELLGGKRDRDQGGGPAREERQASRREERGPRDEQHENAEDDLPF